MTKILNIGYFADGPWSHKAFEKIVSDDRMKIVFIVPRSDSNDDRLKILSEQHNIPFMRNVNINSKEFSREVRKYEADIFVSMSFNQIFKKSIYTLPRLNTINCHAGKLPFYRGRNVLNWAIINDEKEIGVTVHFVDDGIDTGDILSQTTFAISDQDDYGTVLKKAYNECAELLYRTLLNIINGTIERIPQSEIHPTGFYCGGRTVGDEKLNWNQNSRQIFNFIRALKFPGPYARTSIRKKEVLITECEEILGMPPYLGIPGQVLLHDKGLFIVKTSDTAVRIGLVGETKVKVGDRFD